MQPGSPACWVSHPERRGRASVYPVSVQPLVALVLFGFVFVIALCLTVWATLTIGDQTRRVESADSRRTTSRPSVAYVPMAPTKPQVWRGGSQTTAHASSTSQPIVDGPAKPVASNDDYRGARAVVTPRPVTEDAFERFIENERNDRR